MLGRIQVEEGILTFEEISESSSQTSEILKNTVTNKQFEKVKTKWEQESNRKSS